MVVKRNVTREVSAETPDIGGPDFAVYKNLNGEFFIYHKKVTVHKILSASSEMKRYNWYV